MGKSYPGTQSVTRAIQILKAFNDEHPYWSLNDLVEAVDLNKTTVFRILTALESEGLVRRTTDGDYCLGSEAIALGGRAMRANELRTVAHAPLGELARATGETITLEVLHQERDGVYSTLVIDEFLGRHRVGITQYIGSRLPIHATSTGKAMLAHMPPERVQEILSQALTRYTDDTLTTLEAFHSTLAPVREQGYAVAQDELETGLIAVGAPIFDYDCAVQAALSVVGPSIRIKPDDVPQIAQHATTTAQTISHAIGYRQAQEAKK